MAAALRGAAPGTTVVGTVVGAEVAEPLELVSVALAVELEEAEAERETVVMVELAEDVLDSGALVVEGLLESVLVWVAEALEEPEAEAGAEAEAEAEPEAEAEGSLLPSPLTTLMLSQLPDLSP